jgi:hypothetical protein
VDNCNRSCEEFSKDLNPGLVDFNISYLSMTDKNIQQKLSDLKYTGGPYDIKKIMNSGESTIEFKTLGGYCLYNCGNYMLDEEKLTLLVYSECCLKERIGTQYSFKILDVDFSDLEIKMGASLLDFKGKMK